VGARSCLSRVVEREKEEKLHAKSRNREVGSSKGRSGNEYLQQNLLVEWGKRLVVYTGINLVGTGEKTASSGKQPSGTILWDCERGANERKVLESLGVIEQKNKNPTQFVVFSHSVACGDLLFVYVGSMKKRKIRGWITSK